MNKKYYLNNLKYSKFLDSGSVSTFGVYIDVLVQLLGDGGKFLDVGCGTGTVVNKLVELGFDGSGVEISQSSIKLAKKKLGKYHLYDGRKLPFRNESFSVVGSFDVLEHVEDVEKFLNECMRVLKKNGRLIICSPNFTSITNSYHHRTKGLVRKATNLVIILRKFINSLYRQYNFEKFTPIIRPEFKPDDDATNLINIIDLETWAKTNKYSIERSEGRIITGSWLMAPLARTPFIKYLLGGVMIVIKK